MICAICNVLDDIHAMLFALFVVLFPLMVMLTGLLIAYILYNFITGNWEEATQAQKDSIKHLANILKVEYKLTDDDIYEHGEISAHRTFNEGDNLYEK